MGGFQPYPALYLPPHSGTVSRTACSSEVGVSEKLGLENVYSGEDVVNGAWGGRLVFAVGDGIEYVEGSEVVEVVAVGGDKT
jgi:hypothetical protein